MKSLYRATKGLVMRQNTKRRKARIFDGVEEYKLHNRTKRRIQISCDTVSTSIIRQIWKGLTDKPFPQNKISCYAVSSAELFRVMRLILSIPNMRTLDKYEYGIDRPVPHEYSAGLLCYRRLRSGRKIYFILIRKLGKRANIDTIRHELNHIIYNDLEYDKRPGPHFVDSIR